MAQDRAQPDIRTTFRLRGDSTKYQAGALSYRQSLRQSRSCPNRRHLVSFPRLGFTPLGPWSFTPTKHHSHHTSMIIEPLTAANTISSRAMHISMPIYLSICDSAGARAPRDAYRRRENVAGRSILSICKINSFLEDFIITKARWLFLQSTLAGAVRPA